MSIPHPLYSCGSFEDGTFVVRRPYFERVVYRDPYSDEELAILNAHRPLEDYSRALESAGFLVEALREPAQPSSPRWSRIPMFLFARAVKA